MLASSNFISCHKIYSHSSRSWLQIKLLENPTRNVKILIFCHWVQPQGRDGFSLFLRFLFGILENEQSWCKVGINSIRCLVQKVQENYWLSQICYFAWTSICYDNVYIIMHVCVCECLWFKSSTGHLNGDVIAGTERSMFDKQEQWIPRSPALVAKLGLGQWTHSDVTGGLRTVATRTTVALTLAPRLHYIPSRHSPREQSPRFLRLNLFYGKPFLCFSLTPSLLTCIWGD